MPTKKKDTIPQTALNPEMEELLSAEEKRAEEPTDAVSQTGPEIEPEEPPSIENSGSEPDAVRTEPEILKKLRRRKKTEPNESQSEEQPEPETPAVSKRPTRSSSARGSSPLTSVAPLKPKQIKQTTTCWTCWNPCKATAS